MNEEMDVIQESDNLAGLFDGLTSEQQHQVALAMLRAGQAARGGLAAGKQAQAAAEAIDGELAPIAQKAIRTGGVVSAAERAQYQQLRRAQDRAIIAAREAGQGQARETELTQRAELQAELEIINQRSARGYSTQDAQRVREIRSALRGG